MIKQLSMQLGQMQQATTLTTKENESLKSKVAELEKANEKLRQAALMAEQAALSVNVGGGGDQEQVEKLKKELAGKEKAMMDLTMRLQGDLMAKMEAEAKTTALEKELDDTKK